MIKTLELHRYKGFKKFSIAFKSKSLLLGPNNADKSTIIGAIRLAHEAARFTTRNGPRERFRDGDRSVYGHYISKLRTQSFNLENLRYEFEEETTRLSLRYESGATIHLVWPVHEPAFFWLEYRDQAVATAAAAKRLVGAIGVAPTLTPLERDEKQLSPEHLRSNLETKLSSRHLRNNLFAVKETDPDEFESLNTFLLEHTPELAEIQLVRQFRDGESWIDLYYRDTNGRTEKEIYWAGDGLQIWIQILFHIWRVRTSETIILDEPDVFLHPDLQRRLIRILEARPHQVVISSHAAEVASEADPESLVWIERSSSHEKRITLESDRGGITGGLGSAFNLSLARALKAKLALFVKSDDFKLIRILAAQVGCVKLVKEEGLAVIPLQGFRQWPSVQSFAWLTQGFLGSDVKVRLILDSGYRGPTEGRSLETHLLESNVTAHVWHRRELKSYLLEPSIIAAATGRPRDDVVCQLLNILEELKIETLNDLSRAKLSLMPFTATSASKLLGKIKQEFEQEWLSFDNRLRLVPAERIIEGWNKHCPDADGKRLSARSLAKTATTATLDWEVVDLLQRLETELVNQHAS